MRRPRLSFEERKFYLQQFENKKLLDERRGKLYNKKYRKSFIFISTWVLRVSYILLFFIVAVFHQQTGSIIDELVTHVNSESFVRPSKQGQHKVTTLYFETNNDEYTSTLGDERIPEFKINDTIQIEKNIFGKPIYFTKNNWRLKYGLDLNFSFYYIILFVTFVSLFFNDGLDRFTDKILLITWTIDIIGLLCYFLA